LRVPAQGGVALADAMAANGSVPLCLASIKAWPMRPYKRTLSLIALPEA